jgi:3-oxoacyl-[acyl-carrier protein] reductase
MNDRRVALVLAASQGLGRACAEALAASGRDVAVCSRTEDGVRDTVEALEALGVTASGLPTDVTDPAQLERLFDHVDDRFGRLDVLVNNAGGPPPGGFEDLGDEAWARGYELTLMSAVRAMRLALPRFRSTGFGRVVVIGSSSVRRPIPNLVLSNAYRPALAGIVKSLAVELGPEGITVNMVSPGRIHTERVDQLDAKRAEQQGISPEEARSRSEASIPFGRYGEPAELGSMVAYLASDAAGYVTGQSILVDGGQVPTLP